MRELEIAVKAGISYLNILTPAGSSLDNPLVSDTHAE